MEMTEVSKKNIFKTEHSKHRNEMGFLFNQHNLFIVSEGEFPTQSIV